MATFRILCLSLFGAHCLGAPSTSQCADEECKPAQASTLLQIASAGDKSMSGGLDEQPATLPFHYLNRRGPAYDTFTEAPGITDYMFGDEWSNECPEHSTEVVEAADCRAAAEILGRGHRGDMWSTPTNRSSAPRGCYLFKMTSDIVQFNSHPTGAGAQRQYKICKADFLFGQYESTVCPPGSEPIRNATACQSAAEAMDSSALWRGVKNSSSDPSGCYFFFMTSHMVYFNENLYGRGKRSHSVLCASKAAKEAAVRDMVDEVQSDLGALSEALDSLQ